MCLDIETLFWKAFNCLMYSQKDTCSQGPNVMFTKHWVQVKIVNKTCHLATNLIRNDIVIHFIIQIVRIRTYTLPF